MMKLKNNKGYTGIDSSIAIIIILIFVPTIFGIVYNLQNTRARTERKVTALNIATDILEIVRSLDYSDINLEYNGTLKNSLNNKYTTSDYNSSIDSSEEGYAYTYYTHEGENNVHYRIQLGILKYVPENVIDTTTDGFLKKLKL